MLFLRESDGVYQFGSKKVYVKTEGGKILSKLDVEFLNFSPCWRRFLVPE
jgi:hypothetical protein